jgi:hypothetical protein
MVLLGELVMAASLFLPVRPVHGLEEVVLVGWLVVGVVGVHVDPVLRPVAPAAAPAGAPQLPLLPLLLACRECTALYTTVLLAWSCPPPPSSTHSLLAYICNEKLLCATH